ncbi:fumarate hydratase subunit beta [Caldalkalibacillus uzonensis]|uniref:Fumarate hydratase subunit beta n=1 Tax=Caldalkalibacillus uzonensis TaxID=353224 RepID=A0ABU0CXL9_9BACI|nr:Fe-S-containing hydro-lyase [Caldalkalibacillus uzonensis]MDQ0340770.1 fumarate hydratase subunit beta [Caldalkalibacillus uzonensis]
MGVKRISLPLTDEAVEDLRAGDRVLLSGSVLAARDAAHKRLMELIEKGEELPISLAGETIYYVGPTPAKPGQVIGSAGPTTSGRMDKYTPALLSLGLKGMIGKGYRNEAVKEAICKYKAVYFAAVGGSGALLSKAIKHQEIIAYEDLGPEAIRRLTLQDFPVTVINDCHGNDLYQQGAEKYRIE